MQRIDRPLLSLDGGFASTYGRYILKATSETVISWVIASHEALSELVKYTVKKVQACFAFFYDLLMKSHFIERGVEKLVSLFVFEKEVLDAVQAEKALLDQKTGSQVASEFCKLQARYIGSFLETSLDKAKEWEVEKRPPWISSLLTEEAEGLHFTLVGHTIASYVKNKKTFIEKVLELQFLKVFSQLNDRFHKLQHENNFVVHDQIQEMLTKVTTHLNTCTARRVLGQEVPLNEIDFQQIAEDVLHILLPNGEQDLELPVRHFIAKPLRKKIFHLLKTELVPLGIQKLFSKLTRPLSRDQLLLAAFTSLYKIVEEEQLHAPHDDTVYERENEVQKALYNAFLAFIEYIDPSIAPKLVKDFLLQKIATAASKQLCKELKKRPLQRLLKMGLKQIALESNPGGAWEKTRDKISFSEVPFTFVITQQDREERARLKEEKRLKLQHDLEELLSNIGKEGKGLKKIAKESLAKPKEGDATSFLWRPVSFAQNLLHRVSDKTVDTGFEVARVTEKIQVLSATILEKMRDPEHETIVIDLANTLIQLLTAR